MTSPILPCPVSPQALRQHLPTQPLFGNAAETESSIGWRLSPTPYALNAAQYKFLQQLGPQLAQFMHAADLLYRTARKETKLQWVQTLLDKGKPESLLHFAQMNRFKNDLPLVIRPDLLVTPQGFKLSELDSVPGGIGFTAALSQAYQALGFKLAGEVDSIPAAFLKMLSTSGNAPNIAIILSDESADYKPELAWLVETIRKDYPGIYLVHPKQIELQGDQLGYKDDAGQFIPIDVLYRFFELFDLPNIPQIELIQFAIKKGLIRCTPPFKPHLEEKALLGLLHAPRLRPYWESQLGEETFSTLLALVPETWILDPADIPTHAQVVPALNFGGQHFNSFTELGQLTQKQRELVIKPSGFSPLAWGSRGVKMGHDMPQTAWESTLEEALASYNQTPHVLQRFENTTVEPFEFFDTKTDALIQSEGRTRLCPYYFNQLDGLELVGMLATTCPKDKKIIHGMRDGVMRPAYIV